VPTTVTCRQLIEGALKMLGVVGAGITMSGEAAVDGFLVANEMLDGLATERLTIYTNATSTYPLTASQASYTIGVGGNFNQARPLWIAAAGIIDDDTLPNPIEIPIRVLNQQGWSTVSIKSLTGTTVRAIYYDNSWAAGLGRIYVHPIPTGSDVALVLYTPTALTEFASLATPYSFPPGYRRMLRALLAIELAPFYEVEVPASVFTIATQARAYVKRANIKFNVLGVDRGLMVQAARGRRYDISADE
jgi:hypothetical protein